MKGALIGEKLGHSFSAEIHTKLGVDYSLIEVEKGSLKQFVDSADFDYFNVTIPYKKDIIPYLDQLDDASKKIGAVNTVVIKNGKKYGYNTDYYGFKNLLEKNNVCIKGKNAIILGTGGTKETVSCVLKDMGAKSIRVVSRTGEINYSNCYFDDVEIIVNTTPIGMYPNLDMVQLDLSKFKNLKVVVDCIYNPIKTELVIQAENLNVKSFGGLYMLVSQAIYANALVSNNIDFSVTDKIYKELLKAKQNIVLVGMPSCGKSTIGKMLAKKLNKNFVDTDDLIVKKYGDIPTIFSLQGESVFRAYETEIIKEISSKNNLIISSGGGAVLKQENVTNLKHNSIIIYVDRNVALLDTAGRPLSKDLQTLAEMKKVREPIYKSICDFTVENNSDLNSVLDNILKELDK